MEEAQEVKETTATRAIRELFIRINRERVNGQLRLVVNFAEGTPAGDVQSEWISRHKLPGVGESDECQRMPPRGSS